MDAPGLFSELSSHMDLEPAEDVGCHKITSGSKDLYISQAALPNGKRIRLLKTLLTSACERNCYYCPFRAGRDFHRVTFSPDQMAQSFSQIHQSHLADGIFLSSGVAGGGVRTQDRLLATAELLRSKYQYRGYLHLKIMPGAEQAQIEQAMRLADRVSLNLEAPNSQRLAALAPHKTFLEELLNPLRTVQAIRSSKPSYLGWNQRWPSITTQFVVGAVGESDLELLSTTALLNKEIGLSRAYFSAFSPIEGTPLEDLPPGSPKRQQRLYQASFLLRDYGFDLEELPFDPSGNLPFQKDPKTAWAEIHLKDQPVEINQADRTTLLRLPGIGPKSAAAILATRRQNRIQSVEDLQKAGINPWRALPYILLSGKRPLQQLRFW